MIIYVFYNLPVDRIAAAGRAGGGRARDRRLSPERSAAQFPLRRGLCHHEPRPASAPVPAVSRRGESLRPHAHPACSAGERLYRDRHGRVLRSALCLRRLYAK